MKNFRDSAVRNPGSTRHWQPAGSALLVAALTSSFLQADTDTTALGYSFQVIVPAGFENPEIFGMNGLGQISGSLPISENARQGFIYDSKSNSLTLVPETEILTAINDAGTAAGTLKRSGPDAASVCVIRDPAGKLATFSPPSVGNKYADCQARGVGPQGLVSGFAAGDAGMVAFLHDPSSGTFEEFLPTGPGGQVIAQGINSAGQVVGNVRPVAADELFEGSLIQSYGFVRDPDGSIRYFSSKALPNFKARGISDTGLITGFYGETEELRSFVTRISGTSVHQELDIPAHSLLYLKPCSPALRSPGSAWRPFSAMVAAAISNYGVVGGTCTDAWVLFDDQGKDIDFVWSSYAFIASPSGQ